MIDVFMGRGLFFCLEVEGFLCMFYVYSVKTALTITSANLHMRVQPCACNTLAFLLFISHLHKGVYPTRPLSIIFLLHSKDHYRPKWSVKLSFGEAVVTV